MSVAVLATYRVLRPDWLWESPHYQRISRYMSAAGGLHQAATRSKLWTLPAGWAFRTQEEAESAAAWLEKQKEGMDDGR